MHTGAHKPAPEAPPRGPRRLGGCRAAFAGLLLATGAFGVGVALGQQVLGDIVMDRRSTKNGQPGVVFPHWKHRQHFRCYVCHPDPFEMKAGANDITMDALRAGKQCGRCHNGRIAFEVGFETCRRCHSLETAS